MPILTVARTARILKEAGCDLWPMAEPGGGRIKGRHVQSHHLSNLLIALAVSEHYARAPSIIPRYRELVLEVSRSDLAATLENSTPILPGQTFGEALDGLIFAMATDPAPLRSCYGPGDLQFTFVRGRQPIVVVSLNAGKDLSYTNRYGAREQALPGLANSVNRHPAAAIHQMAVVQFDLIDVLGDIARDSLRRARSTLPVSEPAPGVGRKNGEGRSDWHPNGPRHYVVGPQGLLAYTEHLREREEAKQPFASRADRSPLERRSAGCRIRRKSRSTR